MTLTTDLWLVGRGILVRQFDADGSGISRGSPMLVLFLLDFFIVFDTQGHLKYNAREIEVFG